jgi:ribosomal protein L11 methyltransferase
VAWIELQVKLKQETLEQVSSYLFAMGCEGIHVRQSDICIYFSQHQWSEEVKGALVSYIAKYETAFSARSLHLVAVKGEDWNRKWQESFKPIRAGNKVVVSPPWDQYQTKEGETSVVINPQMAFGTGHHETTQLMITCMEAYIQPAMAVLDIGTGSGILAILAKKMGAERVLGIDNDPVAVKNAMENNLRNEGYDSVRFVMMEVNQLFFTEFDMILANINRPVILEMAAVLPNYIKKDGILIISGILTNDELQVKKNLLDAGFYFIEKRSRKEWLAMVFKCRKSDESRD